MAGGRIASRPPPPALARAAADGSAAALVQGDGALTVFELGGVEPPPLPAQRMLPTVPTSLVVCGGKRGRGRVVAFADRHGRVFADVGVDVAGKAARASVGRHVYKMEEGKAVVLGAGGDGVVAAAGGVKKELLVLRGKGVGAGVDGGGGDGGVKRGTGVTAFGLAAEFVAGITAVGVDPTGGIVAVCGQAVVAVDAVTGEVLRRYQGHASPVTACAFFPAGSRREDLCLFVTACAGDQFLSLWDASPVTKSRSDEGSNKKRRLDKRSKGSCHTFVAPEKGVRSVVIDCAGRKGQGGSAMVDEEGDLMVTSIAAILQSGSVAVWSDWSRKNKTAGLSHPTFTVRCSDQDAVLFAAFARPGVLTVAHGHPLRPAFFDVELAKTDAASTVHVPAAATSGLLATSADLEGGALPGIERIAQMEATVSTGTKSAPSEPVAAEKVAVDDRKLLVNGFHDKNAQMGSAQGDTKEAADKSTAGSATVADEKDEDGEETLREKLASMGVATSLSRQKITPGAIATSLDRNSPAESVGNVLAQAVATKDEKLFDDVVQTSMKSATIQTTISRMPFDLATGDCLSMFTTRLINKPGRAHMLMPWIKCILIEHAGALAAQGKSPVLTRLNAAITRRVESLPALTRLEGRLELVCAQANRVRDVRANSATRLAPAVEYIEHAKHVRVGEDSDDSNHELVVTDDESESDSGDADETGDFSESSDDSNSSATEDEEEDIENGKVAKGVEDLMDMSASESES